ncbi:MAG: hypothetical protein KA100_02235 [Rickettsiales bacterium]|nr:hypothetical protein [Rickettsiales bacterium]
MNKIPCKFLEDSRGNKSSKRLWGSILLTTGILFSTILFFYSLKSGAKDAVTALSIINTFLISGSGLLGISVFEKATKQEEDK